MIATAFDDVNFGKRQATGFPVRSGIFSAASQWLSGYLGRRRRLGAKEFRYIQAPGYSRLRRRTRQQIGQGLQIVSHPDPAVPRLL
jgi:hypothetical protein